MIVTYGRIYHNALQAIELLKNENVQVDILKLNVIKPFDERIRAVISKYKEVLFIEEGIEQGGIGESFNKLLSPNQKYVHHGLKNTVEHGKVNELMSIHGLDALGIKNLIVQECVI